jgi:hypothetical protein
MYQTRCNVTQFNVYRSVHRNNNLVYNSNKMHKSQSLPNLTTALHVSGVTITHLQEHKTTVTTASGNSIYYSVTVTRCCSYSCSVLLKMGNMPLKMVDSDAPKYVEQLSDWINTVTCASCWNYIVECYTVYFIWKLALRVSGGTTTHYQEGKQMHLQNLVLGRR